MTIGLHRDIENLENSSQAHSSCSSKGGRVCVGCRKVLPRERLLKITTKRGETSLILDLSFRVPGRSIYLYPSVGCLNNLLKLNPKKSFGRLVSFNNKVNQSAIDRLIDELKQYVSSHNRLDCPDIIGEEI